MDPDPKTRYWAEQFPIPSQTSESDRRFLLSARDFTKDAIGGYSYLEIGSFLGGSLVPFLRDDACTRVLSVDERGRAQPDERGMLYDYSGVTTQTMIKHLRSCGVPVEKLKAYDCSIDALTPKETGYDLAFIDGEHTDEACFRDFLHVLRRLRPDAMVMFHDSGIVYKSLKLIRVYLDSSRIAHTFAKKRGSEMSAVFLGSLADVPFQHWFGEQEGDEAFFASAEANILKTNIVNRVRLQFGGKRLVRLKINSPKIARVS